MKVAKKRNAADVQHAAAIFKALGHPERLRIVCEIADSRVCTQTELVQRLGRPQSTLARHLAVLRSLGLVNGEREGHEVPLMLSGSVSQELLDAACGWIHSAEGKARAFNGLLALDQENT